MKLPPNYLYVAMDNDRREELYQEWAKVNKLDPRLESTVEAFFEAIDRIDTSNSNNEILELNEDLGS